MSSITGEALSNTSEGKPKDFLWLHLRELPYFRALLRAIEARFYQDLDLPAPILDVGCGDGHFASVTFDKPLDVGIDPWRAMLPSAKAYGGYHWVIQGLGNELPFADNRFASVISNSVLEHIPQVDEVVKEIHRVLRPGGYFVFCVPNHRFPQELSISKFFQHSGLEPLASAYSRFFNRISRHHHCDDVPVWQRRLEIAGFTLERYWHYFSPAALHTLEWGLRFAHAAGNYPVACQSGSAAHERTGGDLYPSHCDLHPGLCRPFDLLAAPYAQVEGHSTTGGTSRGRCGERE